MKRIAIIILLSMVQVCFGQFKPNSYDTNNQSAADAHVQTLTVASATAAGTTTFFATNGGPAYVSPYGNDSSAVIGDLNHPWKSPWLALTANCNRGGGVVIVAPGYYEWGTNTAISTNFTQVIAWGSTFGHTNMQTLAVGSYYAIIPGIFYEQWGGNFEQYSTDYNTMESYDLWEFSYPNMGQATNVLRLHNIVVNGVQDFVGSITASSTTNNLDILLENSSLVYGADTFSFASVTTNYYVKAVLRNNAFYGDMKRYSGSIYGIERAFSSAAARGSLLVEKCAFTTTNDSTTIPFVLNFGNTNVVIQDCIFTTTMGVSTPAPASGSTYILNGAYTGNGSGLTNVPASGISTSGGTPGQILLNTVNGTVWTNDQSIVQAGSYEFVASTTNLVTGQIIYTVTGVNTNQFIGAGPGGYRDASGVTNASTALTGSTVKLVTTTTNIPGNNSSASWVATNSSLSFTLTGTPAVPGKYYVRGWFNVTCTNAAAGVRVNLYVVGSDIWAGFFGTFAGTGTDQNVAMTTFGVPLIGDGRVAQIYATVVNTSGSLEAYVTTTQTNRYDWRLYQVSTLAADTPTLTTNSWIRIEKFQ